MKYSLQIENFMYIGFLTAISLLVNGCHSVVYKDKQSEIDSIAARWVPDTREGICSVTASRGNEGILILRGETTFPQAKLEIIKTLNNQGISLIDSIIILPDTINNEKYHGLVSLSVINLRKEPDNRSELVSQAILGTPVLILKSEDSWLLVQTPDRYIAWTENSSVELMNTSEIKVWKQSEKVIFLENTGWIYTSPDESGVVGDLVSGSILLKSGESKGYVKVLLPDGRQGYVNNKKLLDFDNWKSQVLCTEENICRIAATFLGLPYLWGGSSAKAVDCSGFVRAVYFMNGMILSRDASLQSLYGLELDLSNGYSQLKRGDLLFFGRIVNSNYNITHVAIYKGESEYIHASGRVMINSLDSTRSNYNSYRKKSLLTARRIVGAGNEIGIVPVSKHTWY
jgi:SH3-like domain-containing protein